MDNVLREREKKFELPICIEWKTIVALPNKQHTNPNVLSTHKWTDSMNIDKILHKNC